MSRPSKTMAPSLRLLGAADGAQQRRLAGAVGAEQRDDLALLDVEVDAEQHLHAVVLDVDVAADEQLALARRLGHAATPRRPSTRPWRCGGRTRRTPAAVMLTMAPTSGERHAEEEGAAVAVVLRSWPAMGRKKMSRGARPGPSIWMPWVRIAGGMTWV